MHQTKCPGHSWPEAGLPATKIAAFITGPRRRAGAEPHYDNAMNERQRMDARREIAAGRRT
jgi:hypothetical protein